MQDVLIESHTHTVIKRHSMEILNLKQGIYFISVSQRVCVCFLFQSFTKAFEKKKSQMETGEITEPAVVVKNRRSFFEQLNTEGMLRVLFSVLRETISFSFIEIGTVSRSLNCSIYI